MRWQRIDTGDIIWIIKGDNAVARLDYEKLSGWSLSVRTVLSDNWRDIAFFKEPNGYEHPLGMPSVKNQSWEEKDVFDEAEKIAGAMGYI